MNGTNGTNGTNGANEMTEIILESDKLSCTICFDENLTDDDTYKTECNHIFCKNCLDTWFSRGNKCCPLCRSYINEYQDSINHYKLVIYERQNNNQTRNEAVLLAQRLIAENLNLKFYMWFSFLIYVMYFYQYYSLLNNYDRLANTYQKCYNNNTEIEDQLKTMQTNYNAPGTSVSIFDGSIRIYCFHAYEYFGCDKT
jgi:hypothetical protein